MSSPSASSRVTTRMPLGSPSHAPASPPRSAAIGVDFGTSKLCVALSRSVRIVDNPAGERTTPASVAFDCQQVLVGNDAFEQGVLNCANTVQAVKRIIGRTSSQVKDSLTNKSNLVQISAESILCFPSGMKKLDGKVAIKVSYKNEEISVFPEEVAASMFSMARKVAETHLGCAVSRVVVSVPSSFNNEQRLATKQAAELAGMEKISLINEPTAAALQYSAVSNFLTKEKLLVVDFGGGKLDVSLVALQAGTLEVLATSGCPTFGGYDLDMWMVHLAAEKFKQSHNVDILDDRKALVRLLRACEKAKKTLSLLPETFIEVDNLSGNIDFRMKISKRLFTQRWSCVLEKEIYFHVSRCVSEAGLNLKDVDKVLPVGGSMRLFGLEGYLIKIFGSKLTKTVNQDECVAAGAAIKAAMLEEDEQFAQVAVREISCHPIYMLTGNHIDDLTFGRTRIPFNHTISGSRSRRSPIFHEKVSYLLPGAEASSCTLNRENSMPTSKRYEINFEVDDDGIFNASFKTSEAITHFAGPRAFSLRERRLGRKMKSRIEGFEKDSQKEAARVEAMVQLEEMVYCVRQEVAALMEKMRHSESECEDVLAWLEDHQTASKKDCRAKRLQLKKLVSNLSEWKRKEGKLLKRLIDKRGGKKRRST
ncbi:putative heat shock 70 kDa protein 7 [Hyalella azteca]|uniref:Heat shock 70 kDa protein 7 n=2 Tax=Hyalella azteca TaxID=294128 RepID=A0A8B7NTG0_HYAAZ|nr:putative heat shock 70 kDa protein 7 [Hyalella azteca]